MLALMLERCLKANLLLYVALQAILAGAAHRAQQLAPKQFPPLDLRWQGYTAGEALALIKSYPPAGLKAVAAAEIIDLAYAVVYPTVLASLLGAALLRLAARPALHYALLVPFAAGAADLVENALVLRLLLFKGALVADGAAARAVAAASRVKWALVAAAVALAALAGAALALQKLGVLPAAKKKGGKAAKAK